MGGFLFLLSLGGEKIGAEFFYDGLGGGVFDWDGF